MCLGGPTPPAVADCAFDPDALSIRQMILQRTTGEPRYDVLFLGRVRRVIDVDEGEEGGRSLARFRVRAHPVGFAPRHARVHFYELPPGVGSSASFEFHPGRRYAVVSDPRDDGTFRFDGACGETTKLSEERMHRLIRLDRRT